jgi:hypothetical protein
VIESTIKALIGRPFGGFSSNIFSSWSLSNRSLPVETAVSMKILSITFMGDGPKPSLCNLAAKKENSITACSIDQKSPHIYYHPLPIIPMAPIANILRDISFEIRSYGSGSNAKTPLLPTTHACNQSLLDLSGAGLVAHHTATKANLHHPHHQEIPIDGRT